MGVRFDGFQEIGQKVKYTMAKDGFEEKELYNQGFFLRAIEHILTLRKQEMELSKRL